MCVDKPDLKEMFIGFHDSRLPSIIPFKCHFAQSPVPSVARTKILSNLHTISVNTVGLRDSDHLELPTKIFY